MSNWIDQPAVVLDNGTGMVKCGFAGEDSPSVVFPALVGRQIRGDDVLVGDAAANQRGYKLKYPIVNGIVEDWDGMELIWREAWKQLDCPTDERPVLLTEAPLNPKENREKMAEVLFENFNVPALNVQIQAVLTLFSAGTNDGLVVDSGDGVTHIVPVYDSRVTKSTVCRSELAGRALTHFLGEVLSHNTDVDFSKSYHNEWLKTIKEKHCYLEMDFEAAEEKYDDENDDIAYTLPDGNEIKLGRERYQVPEALFCPELMESDDKPIHDLIQEAIWNCGVDCRMPLISNIVLSGGTTLFPGMEDRLLHELKNHPKITPKGKEMCKIISDSSDEGRGIRKYSVWMGASILGGLSSLSERWITKSDYEEQGPTCLHTMCDSLSY